MHVTPMQGTAGTGYPYYNKKTETDTIQNAPEQEPAAAEPQTQDETTSQNSPEEMWRELSVYSQLTQMLQNLAIDYEEIGWIDENGKVQRDSDGLYDLQESA